MEEKKSVDISTFYARQEILKLMPIWEEAKTKIDNLMSSSDEPDSDTLAEIVKTLDSLKKAAKPMSLMALLLAKQKACETFLEEKGLSDEFADFTAAPKKQE